LLAAEDLRNQSWKEFQVATIELRLNCCDQICPSARQTLIYLSEKTLKERQALTDRLGKIVGVKLVREERVSDFLYRITYAEKARKTPASMAIYFYRPQNQWMLNAFNWDDRAMLLFDDGHPN
jgi:hypothetical protein